MVVYVFAFALMVAIGWHLAMDRFCLALLGSVATSVLVSSFLMFVFIGWQGFLPFAKEALVFAAVAVLVSAIVGKLIAKVKQQKPQHVREQP